MKCLTGIFFKDENLLEGTEVQQIRGQLDIMRTLKTTMSVLEETLKSLQDTRMSLVRYTDVMIQHEAISDSVCPLCGASYVDRDELLKRLKRKQSFRCVVRYVCSPDEKYSRETIHRLF